MKLKRKFSLTVKNSVPFEGNDRNFGAICHLFRNLNKVSILDSMGLTHVKKVFDLS